jgi:gamma-glutamyltranspeptidase/glutathione hydrolase
MNIQWEFPYPSQRMPIFARNVVATSQPLAAQAGLKMLVKGGNALDAALATAIALTVVEPTSNGIGSDAFALVWNKGRLFGLNGSGKSPGAWNYKRFSMLKEMPLLGWDAVTVPGAVDAWVKAPAVEYANNGFIVSPITAARWLDVEQTYLDFPEFGRTFMPGGKAPRAGQVFCCPDQAMSLTAIAQSRGESFNRGDLAKRMVACATRRVGS